MGRQVRIEFPGALYHVLSRGNEKKRIFKGDSDFFKFLEILKNSHQRYGIRVYCYVLMDNHYHILIETPNANLQKVMHNINSAYGNYFNHRHNRIGHLFAGRYKAILVDKDAYLLQLSRYLHLNPVKAGIVEQPEEYRWSSFAGYISEKNRLSWLDYAVILNMFDLHKEKAMENYCDFVKQSLYDHISNPLEDARGQLILGRDEFVRNVNQFINGSAADDSPLGSMIKLEKKADAHDLLKIVSVTFNTEEDLFRRKGFKANEARGVAVYLLKQITDLTNYEIAEMFGGIETSAVSKIAFRMKEKLLANVELGECVKRIIAQCQCQGTAPK